MTGPTYDLLIHPLLQVLASYEDGLTLREVRDAVAETIGLPEEDRNDTIPSGQKRFANRIGWAHDRLKRAGLSECLRRGHWRLTAEGQRYARHFNAGLPEQELRRLATAVKNVRLPQPDDSQAPDPENSGGKDAGTQTPEDRIDEAVRDIHEGVSLDLLELNAQSSPAFFEGLVLRVLLAMGYGASVDDLLQTGRAGDGGLDGVIHLDRLGLTKVYVQAKRWAPGQTVGRPDIQRFYGALAAQRATKGVFITTSSYSREAQDYARNVSDGLALVDGRMLTQLMIEYEVGVSVAKTVKVVGIDSDFFEEL